MATTGDTSFMVLALNIFMNLKTTRMSGIIWHLNANPEISLNRIEDSSQKKTDHRLPAADTAY